MLFNSYEFIFMFLPATWLVYALLRRQAWPRLGMAWLILASLFFYGWWNPVYVPLLLGSIAFNYAVGAWLVAQDPQAIGRRKTILALGIAGDLGLLGYFKYTGFLIDTANLAFGTHFAIAGIVLPLAISFHTFQQIAWLVDAYRERKLDGDPFRYLLFVTFFPQLIAGPIVHHREFMPQVAGEGTALRTAENLSLGLTIFAIGLFKKAVIADSLAVYATPVFDLAARGTSLNVFEAWSGALAYTLQLYFDFSGYSDMAIGLAWMFGLRLPINFDSPYKAASIVDFWRRWHMTLSRFLRDYLYVPLGGSRQGGARRYANLMTVMLLGGLWHGAGWTYVLWGGLHGFYLVVNHGWRALRRALGLAEVGRWWSMALARLVTFLAVVVAWVFFRAPDLDGALAMLRAMAGLDGLSLPSSLAGVLGGWAGTFGLRFDGMMPTLLGRNYYPDMWGFVWIPGMLAVAWLAPNTQEIMGRFGPALLPAAVRARVDGWRLWTPSPRWALVAGGVMAAAILAIQRDSEFLYFQF